MPAHSLPAAAGTRGHAFGHSNFVIDSDFEFRHSDFSPDL
jgi:hypothetical protein